MGNDPNLAAKRLASQLNIKWDERCEFQGKVTTKFLERVLGALLAIDLASKTNIAKDMAERRNIDWQGSFMHSDGSISEDFFEKVLESLRPPMDLSHLLGRQ